MKRPLKCQVRPDCDGIIVASYDMSFYVFEDGTESSDPIHEEVFEGWVCISCGAQTADPRNWLPKA